MIHVYQKYRSRDTPVNRLVASCVRDVSDWAGEALCYNRCAFEQPARSKHKHIACIFAAVPGHAREVAQIESRVAAKGE
jgi:hypothetical protein